MFGGYTRDLKEENGGGYDDTLLYTCMKLSKINYNKKEIGGWRDRSAVKSMYCSCRGHKFTSQHPHQTAHDLKLQLQEDLILLAFMGSCVQMPMFPPPSTQYVCLSVCLSFIHTQESQGYTGKLS